MVIRGTSSKKSQCNFVPSTHPETQKLHTISLGSSSDDISRTAFNASVYSCVVRMEGGTEELD